MVKFVSTLGVRAVTTCTISWAIIMHHPLSSSHHKGMILGYLQIIHRLGSRDHLPPYHHTDTAIRPQEVHPQRDLAHRQEAVLHREEGMLLVGMHYLARLCGGFAMFSLRG